MTRSKRTRAAVAKESTLMAAEVRIATSTDGGDAVPIELPREFIEAHTAYFIKACRFVLNVDPTLLPVLVAGNFSHYLKTVIKASPEITKEVAPPKVDLQECFAKLGGAIIGQQISNTAAKSIRTRVCDYFGGSFPTYEALNTALKDPHKRQEIKECGLSLRKLGYLESLAQYFTSKTNEISILFNGEDNDEEIIKQLVDNVKGIGPWSASMFLINALRRPNVFTADDLGIARGFSNYVSKRPELIAELMSQRTVVKKSKIKHKKYNWKIYDSDIMELCAQRFQPYRTLFMFLLWRLSSDDMEFMVKMQEEFMQS